MLNRASFSGCTLRSGLSVGHPRLNQASMERIKNFSGAPLRDKFFIQAADYSQSIASHPDSFLFLDPAPMPSKIKIYMVSAGSAEKFDHTKLYDILHKRGGMWLLCYNNSDFIKELYSGYKYTSCAWKYGMGLDKQSRELIVFSKALAQKLDSC